MKFNFKNEMVNTILSGACTIGAAIIVEGTKGVLLKTVTNTITTSFEGGIEGVKKMTVSDFVGKKKKKLIEIPKFEVESKDKIEVVTADEIYVERRDVH